MQKFKELKLGDRKYTINYFLTSEALDLSSDLVRLTGLPLAILLTKKKDQAIDVLPIAVEALSTRLRDVHVSAFIRHMLSCVVCEGQSVGARPGEDMVRFDTHFQGHLGDLFTLVTEAVKFNFEDFMRVALAAGLKEMAGKTKPVSNSPTSNG